MVYNGVEGTRKELRKAQEWLLGGSVGDSRRDVGVYILLCQ
jgi:hypothetical protein